VAVADALNARMASTKISHEGARDDRGLSRGLRYRERSVIGKCDLIVPLNKVQSETTDVKKDRT
jgi:hypothetical protein